MAQCALPAASISVGIKHSQTSATLWIDGPASSASVHGDGGHKQVRCAYTRHVIGQYSVGRCDRRLQRCPPIRAGRFGKHAMRDRIVSRAGVFARYSANGPSSGDHSRAGVFSRLMPGRSSHEGSAGATAFAFSGGVRSALDCYFLGIRRFDEEACREHYPADRPAPDAMMRVKMAIVAHISSIVDGW